MTFLKFNTEELVGRFEDAKRCRKSGRQICYESAAQEGANDSGGSVVRAGGCFAGRQQRILFRQSGTEGLLCVH